MLMAGMSSREGGKVVAFADENKVMGAGKFFSTIRALLLSDSLSKDELSGKKSSLLFHHRSGLHLTASVVATSLV